MRISLKPHGCFGPTRIKNLSNPQHLLMNGPTHLSANARNTTNDEDGRTVDDHAADERKTSAHEGSVSAV